MAVKIQFRRDLAANWGSSTVLASGEVGYETDTGNIKIGNGSTQWSALAYYQLPRVSVNPATTSNLNAANYLVQGIYRLATNSNSGVTWTGTPTDFHSATTAESTLTVTIHQYTGQTTLTQQVLTQRTTTTGSVKQWVRLWDGTTLTEWTSTAHLSDNEVTFAKMQDIAGLSVIGKTGNGSGDPAEITAATSGHVLRYDGTNVAFGTLASTAFSASTNVPLNALADQAALSVVANGTNALAAPTAIAAGTDGHVLRRSGTAVGFGTIVNAGVDANAAIALSKLASMAQNTVVGVTTAGVPGALTTGSAGTARTALGLGSLAYLTDIVEETSSSVNNGTTNFDGSSLTVGRLTLITISWSQGSSTPCTWNIVSESGEAFLVLFAGMTNEDGVGSLSTGPYDSVGTDSAGRQQFIFGALTRKVAFRQGFASGFTGTVYAVVIRLK